MLKRRLARKLFGLAATTVVVGEKTKVQASVVVLVAQTGTRTLPYRIETRS